MNGFEVLPFLGILAGFVMPIYVTVKAPGRQLNIIFALYCTLVFFASVSSFVTFTTQSPEQAILFDRVETFMHSLSGGLLLHFLLKFTKSRLASKPLFIAALYLPSFVFAYITAATDMLTAKGAVLDYWGYFVEPNELLWPFLVYVTVYIASGLIMVFRFYRKTKSPAERKQAFLIVTGTAILFVGGIGSQGVLPELGYQVPPLVSFLFMIQALFVFHAIIRYKLMALTPSIAAENIIRTMADYLLVLNKDGSVAFTSDSILRGLGYRNKVGLEGGIGMIFSAKPLKGITMVVEKKGTVSDVNFSLKTKEGKDIPVSLNGSVIRAQANETLGYVLIMRDMTRIEELIADLESRTVELERSKKELEVSKEQLEVKMAEAERLNKLAVGRELKMIELKRKLKDLGRK